MEGHTQTTMNEINENDDGFIPIPELFKDTFLIGGFITLSFFGVVAYLGRWRRSILGQDRMTLEFQELRERAKALAKNE